MIHSFFFHRRPSRAKVIKHLQGERKKQQLWDTSKMTPNYDIIRYQKTFLKIISFLFSLHTFSLHSSAHKHIFYALSKSFYSWWTNQPQACSQTILAFWILKAVTEAGLISFQSRTQDRYQIKNRQNKRQRRWVQSFSFYFCLHAVFISPHRIP